MSRLKIITKYFIRNALDEMFAGTKMAPSIVVIGMLCLFALLSLPFSMMIWGSYNTFHAMGQEGMLLAIILSAGSTVTFFFGIYVIMNVFYFSKDIEVILPLPFKSSEIVFGKFAAVLLNMYVYTGMLILPLIVYGVTSKASLMYYLYALIVFLIIPILPMIFASLICMALMRFANLSKHKDAFKMFTGCASLIIIVLFNFFNTSSGKNSRDMLQRFAEGNNNMIDMMNGIFITNKFSSYALLYNNQLKGLLYIIVSLILSLIIFSIYYYIGGKLYLKGIIGINEAYSERENILENGKVDKLTKINSPLKALVKRDIKVIFRTPQFFINCVAMIFYMPAIIGMAMLSNGKLSQFRSMLDSGPKYYGFVIVAAFIGGSACIMTGGAGATALSREGKDFIISKYIPVDYKIQLHSKIISSLCIDEFGAVIIAIILILLGAKPVLAVLGVIASIGSILLITMIGIYIDFRNPKLNWENERAMFKNNYISLIIMLIAFVLGVILVGIAVIIKNYFIIFGICMGIVAIGSYILYKFLFKLAYRMYNEN